MRTVFIGIQFTSAIALVVAVLLHTAKGEGLAGIGGTARLFGSQKGLEAGLDKITTTLAVIFLLFSAILGVWSGS